MIHESCAWIGALETTHRGERRNRPRFTRRGYQGVDGGTAKVRDLRRGFGDLKPARGHERLQKAVLQDPLRAPEADWVWLSAER